MEIFGVGLGEFVFILVIAVIILGPDGMVKAAHTLGVTARKVIHSPVWSMLMSTQKEIREIPTRLVREAGLEEDLKELQKANKEVKSFSLNQYTKDVLKETPETTAPSETIKPPEPASLPQPQSSHDTGDNGKEAGTEQVKDENN